MAYGKVRADLIESSTGEVLDVDNALGSLNQKATKEEVTESQEELINGNVFPKKGVLTNGMTVPVGTTHLRILVGGESTIVAMLPSSSGIVSGLTENTATIGPSVVRFATPRYIENKSIKISAFNVAGGSDISQIIIDAVNLGFTDILVDGDYTISDGNLTLTNDISLTFDGELSFAQDATFTIRGSIPYDLTSVTTYVPSYKEMYLQFSDVSNIDVGDFIYINTTTIGETSWNYTRQFGSVVSHIVGNNVYLERLSTFNFNAVDITGLTVNLYKERKLKINNLKQNTESTITLGKGGFVFSGLSLSINNLEQKNAELSYAMFCAQCYNCTIDGFTANNGTYPFLYVGSSNLKAGNLVGANCHHLVATGDFSDGVYVDGITGTGPLMESHPAFNVHYNNADIVTGQTNDDNYVNLRSVGGSIKNSKFRHKGSPAVQGPYVQNVVLTDEDSYKDCIFEMENVSWYENKDGSSIPVGLTVDYGETITLKNVKAGNGIRIGPVTSSSDIYGKTRLENVDPGDGVIDVRHEEVDAVVPDSVDANFNALDSVYEIYPAKVGVNPNNYKISGNILKNNLDGDGVNIPLRIYPIGISSSIPAYIYSTLKLKLGTHHNNAGQYQYTEREFAIWSKWTSTGGLSVGATPIYENTSPGQANDTGDISIILSTQTYNISGGIEGNYIDLTVELTSGGRASPIFDTLDYELVNSTNVKFTKKSYS